MKLLLKLMPLNIIVTCHIIGLDWIGFGQRHVGIMKVIVYSGGHGGAGQSLTRCHLTLRGLRGDAVRDKIKFCFNNQAAHLIYPPAQQSRLLSTCCSCLFKLADDQNKRVSGETNTSPSMATEWGPHEAEV